MPDYELAQLNVAVMKQPLESPAMAEFVANLDRINALADGSPGFVWRLQTDAGDATALRPFGADTLVNMSVWTDLGALRQFVYRSAHGEVLGRRAEWFERLSEAYLVLWWVPSGHRPTLEEAKARLDAFRRAGPSADGFDFRSPFPPPCESVAIL